jgi:hypothetical protein
MKSLVGTKEKHIHLIVWFWCQGFIGLERMPNSHTTISNESKKKKLIFLVYPSWQCKIGLLSQPRVAR